LTPVYAYRLLHRFTVHAPLLAPERFSPRQCFFLFFIRFFTTFLTLGVDFPLPRQVSFIHCVFPAPTPDRRRRALDADSPFFFRCSPSSLTRPLPRGRAVCHPSAPNPPEYEAVRLLFLNSPRSLSSFLGFAKDNPRVTRYRTLLRHT